MTKCWILQESASNWSGPKVTQIQNSSPLGCQESKKTLRAHADSDTGNLSEVETAEAAAPVNMPGPAFIRQGKQNQDIFVSSHLQSAGREEAEEILLAHTTEGKLADLTVLFSEACSIWMLPSLAG